MREGGSGRDGKGGMEGGREGGRCVCMCCITITLYYDYVIFVLFQSVHVGFLLVSRLLGLCLYPPSHTLPH